MWLYYLPHKRHAAVIDEKGLEPVGWESLHLLLQSLLNNHVYAPENEKENFYSNDKKIFQLG